MPVLTAPGGTGLPKVVQAPLPEMDLPTKVADQDLHLKVEDQDPHSRSMVVDQDPLSRLARTEDRSHHFKYEETPDPGPLLRSLQILDQSRLLRLLTEDHHLLAT